MKRQLHNFKKQPPLSISSFETKNFRHSKNSAVEGKFSKGTTPMQ